MSHTQRNPLISGLKFIKRQAARLRPHLPGKGRIGVAAGVVAVIGGCIALSVVGLPDWKAVDVAKEVVALNPTLEQLEQAAANQPKDAEAQLALGHAAFDRGDRALGVDSYRRALRLDAAVATSRMTSNLLECFGQDEQWAAASLLSRYKLVEAEESLRTLTNHRAHWVRSTAVETLGKLGKATSDDVFRVYLADLRVKDCEVRQAAMRNLADIGDRRALEPIRRARDKDLEETPWYGFRCLRVESEYAIEKLTRTRYSTRPLSRVASR
jgi:hypothetical protein